MASEPAVAGGSPELSLVPAAQAGDRVAFGRLYVLYSKTVHAILLARVPAGVAEDLVQDVFVQAMKSIRSLRDPAAFPGWLARIARNKAHDYFRRTPPVEELPQQMAGGSQPTLDATAALAAIRSLPEAYQETMLMRLVEGMSGPEIAARTGMTHESVRVHLSRGMKMLRERLS